MRMGRKRLYSTAAKLKKSVDEYFNGISRLRTLTELVPTGRHDSHGMPVMEPREIINVLGKPIVVEEFLIPPSLNGLRLYLRISDETWRRYSADKELGPVCAEAKLRIEAYLERQLIENPKAARGIIFNLTANFGWREKREIGLDEQTRQTVAATMTMDEKLALLIEAAASISGDSGDDEPQQPGQED